MDGADTEPNILEHLLDEQEKEPCRLEIALLRTITKNFSDDQIIGSGGCGVIYKGNLRNGTVAVKKLFNAHTIDENMFDREVKSMMIVNHENIVRFLGYCSDTQGEAINMGQKIVMGEVRERLLCFEYIENGSLQNHIKDELRGLKWPERYKIIRGICEGLHHLHKEKHIRHMDLKPDNILLGDHLVPKITDFGLARLDEKSQTMSKQRLLSPGYCAPEYQFHGKMSAKSDIYSLGVIILELVTASKKDPDIVKVLQKWRHRWNKSSENAPLLWYRQVAKCIDLSQWCKRENPLSRPDICNIISELHEIDSWDGQIRYANVSTFDKIMSSLEDMLGIEPLEMHFPFVLNEPMSCSIEINNDTDDCFAFRIQSTSLLLFSTQPDIGIVEPRSKLSAIVTLQAQDKALSQNHCSEEFSVQSFRIDEIPTSMDVIKHMFNDVDGRVVDEVILSVVFGLPPAPEEDEIDMDFMKCLGENRALLADCEAPLLLRQASQPQMDDSITSKTICAMWGMYDAAFKNLKDDPELVDKWRNRVCLMAIALVIMELATPWGAFWLQNNSLLIYKAFFYCKWVTFMLCIAAIMLLVNTVQSKGLLICTGVCMYGLVCVYASGSMHHFRPIYTVLIAIIVLLVAAVVIVFLQCLFALVVAFSLIVIGVKGKKKR